MGELHFWLLMVSQMLCPGGRQSGVFPSICAVVLAFDIQTYIHGPAVYAALFFVGVGCRLT